MNARPEPAEWQVQIALVEHMKRRALPGVWFSSIPNGGYLADPRAVAKLKACGLVPGAPDMLVIVGGHAHGMELKVRGGRLSAEQIAAGEAWTAAGGTYAVATGLDAALLQLVRWGAIGPDRGARRLSDLFGQLDEAP